MMMIMNTKDTIREFIAVEILHDALATPLTDQDLLIESGIIDSLGIMTLLTFLEEKFSIQIPGEDLMPENFSSISSITTLIERHLNN
jgi:acyl carrier protein